MNLLLVFLPYLCFFHFFTPHFVLCFEIKAKSSTSLVTATFKDPNLHWTAVGLGLRKSLRTSSIQAHEWVCQNVFVLYSRDWVGIYIMKLRESHIFH